MHILVSLLITIFPGLSHTAGVTLLRRQDMQWVVPELQSGVTTDRVWKLRVLYPNLRGSYWLPADYGMLEAARKYGVSLKVLEAGGYRQFSIQKIQVAQRQRWGADVILLGSSTTTFPDLSTQVGALPVTEVVSTIDDSTAKTRVGVPWFQMGYQPGRCLVKWSGGKPLKALLLPGPDDVGGSREVVAGLRQVIASSQVNIADVVLGDNDIEAQHNPLQEMPERHPDADVVADTAIAAEAAMGEKRNPGTSLTVVSLYPSHQVYRGLKHERIIMAANDQMVRQGGLATQQVIRVLQRQPTPESISPPILVLTPKDADSRHARCSLPPDGFCPVYLYQHAPAIRR